MNNLSHELLVEIVKRLDLSTNASVRTVSRSLREAADADDVWDQLIERLIRGKCYIVMPHNQARLTSKQKYKFILQQSKRNEIWRSELIAFRWLFRSV